MATHRKGPAEHRYCVVQVRMHGDEKFKRLSKPQPNAQTLWCYLLHGPRTTRLPGVVIGGRGAMAHDDLKWPIEAFDDCFDELVKEEMAIADWDAGLVYLVNAFRQEPNRPSSPSTAATWKRELANAPECPLLLRITSDLRDLLKTMHPSFLRSFDRGSRRDFRAKLPAPLPGELPSALPSPSPAPALEPSPAPALPPTGVQGAGGRLEGRKVGPEKALPAPRPQQLTIADRVDPAPGGAPPQLGEVLRRIEARGAKRFVISHRTKPGERRNGAAEQITMGLPQLLWDQLRAAVHELAPTLEQVDRLGEWIGAGGWAHLEVVTPDYLCKHLHDGLTRSSAWDGMPLRPDAPAAALPEVTAAAGTPEFFAQLRARKVEQERRTAAQEKRYGR